MSWDEASISQWTLDLEADEWSGHFVYVALPKSRRGRPVYIGKSSALRQRIGNHMANAPWRAEVGAFTFHRFATAEDAARAELLAIQALNPKHNMVRHRYYGPSVETDEIAPDQLAIVARVQNRRSVAR